MTAKEVLFVMGIIAFFLIAVLLMWSVIDPMGLLIVLRQAFASLREFVDGVMEAPRPHEIILTVLAVFGGWLVWQSRRNRQRFALVSYRLGRIIIWPVGMNNRRANLFAMAFLAIFAWEGYEVGQVVVSCFDEPILDQLTESAPKVWYPENLRVVQAQTPTEPSESEEQEDSIRSVGWFVQWTGIALFLALVWVIYLPISMREEFQSVMTRIQWRIAQLRQSEGGMLERERPGFLRQLLEKRVLAKPEAVTAAVLAAPSGAGPTTPSSAVLSTSATAQPAAEVRKPGFFEKWGHWLAILPIWIEELFFEGRSLFRRNAP